MDSLKTREHLLKLQVFWRSTPRRKTHLVFDEETAFLALLIYSPGGRLWAFSANVEGDTSLWVLTNNDDLIADEDDYPEVFAAAMDKKFPSTLGSEAATRRFNEALYEPYVIGF